MSITIRELDARDKGYALSSWRESHKASPGCDHVPWSFYKHEWGTKLAAIINDPGTLLLGAYDASDRLLGWIAATEGKRVDTLHWVHVKYELDGKHLRRQGLMLGLIEAADLGDTFVYTCRARRDRTQLPDGSMSKTLDESLVAALAGRGVTASYISLKDWLR